MTLDPAQKATMAQPERRSRPRTRVPSIEVRCDDGLYVTDDWGLGGCRFSNYTGEWRPGTSTFVELFLNIDQDHEGLPVKAEVVRFEPENNNALAMCFVGLGAQNIVDFCNRVDSNLGAQVAQAIE